MQIDSDSCLFYCSRLRSIHILCRLNYHNTIIHVSVPVFQIKEVRSGKTTEALKNREIAGIYPDECAFSIVFGDNFESMDLIANTPDEANIWVTGLTCLLNTGSRSPNCATTGVNWEIRNLHVVHFFMWKCHFCTDNFAFVQISGSVVQSLCCA